MTNQKNLLTKEGKLNLKNELKSLVEIERAKVIADIKEARERGDLSENAEFDAARDKQAQIEGRISEIENILNNSQTVNTTAKNTTGKVRVGSKVVIKKLKDSKESEYTIVGSLETNPFEKKISNESPMAQALLGKEKGDKVTVIAKVNYQVQIVSVK